MNCLLFISQIFRYTIRQAWMPPDTLTMQSADCVTGVLGGAFSFWFLVPSSGFCRYTRNPELRTFSLI